MSESRQFDAGDDRSEERFGILIAGHIAVRGARHGARINNVSRSGAQIWSPRFLEIGDQLDLIVGANQVAAYIEWERHPYYGLRFDRPIQLSHFLPDLFGRFLSSEIGNAATS